MIKKPLNRWAHLRLNEDEEKMLNYLAEHLGEKNRSRLLRKMIREAGGLGPDLLKDEMILFREGVKQLTAVGRNLNQIARAVNTGKTSLEWNPELIMTLDKRIGAVKTELSQIILRTQKRWVNLA